MGVCGDVQNCRVQTNVAASYATLEKYEIPSGVCIKPAKNVDFDKLSAYDTAAFGAPHHLFLKGLLNGANTITLAATNTAGDIVGFVAARKTILEAEGWKVAPMYADNGKIVRALLSKVLFQMKADSPQRKVCMLELALDLHPDTAALAKELNAVELLPLNGMLTKGPLQFTKEKVYSYGAGELG